VRQRSGGRGGKAAVTGDLVLIGTEVNDAVRALRPNGIDVSLDFCRP
jgi:hypothetical protein